MSKKVFLFIALFFLIIIFLLFIFNLENYFNILNLCFSKSINLTPNLFVSICVIFCFILIFLVLDILLVVYNGKIENKGLNIKKDDATHGSAKWLEEKEIFNILGNTNTPGIILGKYNKELVKLPFDSYFNKNICVFGSSGSMKTIGFLLTNILELSLTKKSIIITDPKGEIFRTTSSFKLK